MEASQVILETFALPLICFAIGNQFGNFTLASSLVSFFIVLFCFYGFIISALGVFLGYLILDTFWRNDKLPNEIFLHHLISFGLTFSGLNILFLLPPDLKEVTKLICFYLLCMEFTTPILHMSKYLHKNGYKGWDSLFMGLLVIFWVPFRIWNPIMALHLLHQLDLSFSHPSIPVMGLFSTLLCFMQVMWFLRLCRISFESAIGYKDDGENKIDKKNR